MTLLNFQWYVIIINVIAFLVYTIDFQIYRRGGSGIKPEAICNLVTILGGAIGTFIAEMLWERKINKRNIQSRFYTFIWLFLQLAVFWAILGPNNETVKEQTLSFYNSHKVICIYYAILNVVTFITFAIDKIKAIMGAWRIREIVLLGLCLIGGGVGGVLAMDLCDHKVNKTYFMFGVPAMICVHLCLIVLILMGAI